MKQSGQLKDKAYWIGRKAELFFIKRSKFVLSPSKAMVNFVESEMKKKMMNVKIIPYPIDESMNKDSSKNEDNESGKVIIIFASRNDPVKGGDLFLRALYQIPDDLKSKISGFCGVDTRAVIPSLDADSIYSVPLALKKEGLSNIIYR